MPDGVVEYALVHTTGKVHESVLKTAADPFHIHLARLLVGPPEPISARPPGQSREMTGARLTIWAQWSVNGTQHRSRLEDFVLNTLTKSRMSRGDWVYTGSRVVQGTFLAQRDGSVVGIVDDPDALVNNPRPGRDDDEIWKANSSTVPPVGTPVDVIFDFSQSNEN
jgi:hypothetical protein